jgi:hypothetical protein
LPEYRIWKAIKTRCLNPNADHYERYGGRGIKICERWSLDFASFLTDMGRRPSSKYEIDRIDNDGNYEPGNCRWVTHSVNVANHPSRLSKSGYRGVLIVKSGRFQALISVERVRTCIGTFATADEAAWMYDQYAMCLWPDIDILNLVYEK